MTYPNRFIKATEQFNSFEQFVPAPYVRKGFFCKESTTGKLMIAVCGFYELFVNGKNITKGRLAPYISNTDDYIYCDDYEVNLDAGENVVGVLLGNGFQNNPGGYIWDFDKVPFRSAPKMALTLQYREDGQEVLLESGADFKTMPSAIRSDDYRFGETYDANFAIDGWCDKGFDDSAWGNMLETKPPRGELRLCAAEPIIQETELQPVAIFEEEDGFVYDFGQSNAGVCRLTIRGEKGQRIELQHADGLKDGKFFLDNVWFVRDFWERDRKIVHKDVYICKGEGEEIYTPTFTYHGFRYVKVTGITEAQATPSLLTYCVLHSDLRSRGGFSCSNETVNTLQEITRRSDTSNFYYFPTDCPQREKNGWTADAALSTEQMLLNFNPEVSYREWLRNICKAQRDDGRLPGIIPTGTWGIEWGNGPAWDSVLVYLPYFVYIYRGETDMIRDSAKAIMSYLHYITTRKDEKGLIHIGLGDWCHVGREPGDPKAPLAFTDTLMSMDIANKAAVLFEAVGMVPQRDFARAVAEEFRGAIREHLVDWETVTVAGNCQSGQAMSIFAGVFTEEEAENAFRRLLEMIHAQGDHMDIGVLGSRVLFQVLSRYDHSDLALKMILHPTFPSYANWLERGATTLWEGFRETGVGSMNHHFWGSISAWFIKCLAGIQFNPHLHNTGEVEISPAFVEALDHAEGFYEAPAGKIAVSWKREKEGVLLTLEIPEAMQATAVAPNGYRFADGTAEKTVTSGNYPMIKV